jgi:hypothetical protein
MGLDNRLANSHIVLIKKATGALLHFIRYENVAHQARMHCTTITRTETDEKQFVPNISLAASLKLLQAPAGMFAPARKTVGNVLHLALQQRFRRLDRME